jgi:hypothetical protein
MDFSTIKKKIDRDEYNNLDQFENDFGLIIKNCHFFNEAKCSKKTSEFYFLIDLLFSFSTIL